MNHRYDCAGADFIPRFKNRDIYVFDFGDMEFRVVFANDEPWFVAKEVTDYLGGDLSCLDEDDIARIIIFYDDDYPDEKKVINTHGLFRLIYGSKRPDVSEFKKWIADEVLPAFCVTAPSDMDIQIAEIDVKIAELEVLKAKVELCIAENKLHEAKRAVD